VLWLVLPAAGFAFGSIPFSFLIARSRGIDLRREGSGNVGATNLARLCGKKAGAAGFALDVLKGAIPAGASLLAGAPGELRAITALAAIAGHVFTPWLGFRGGKGVATALGALAVLVPLPAAAALAIFALVLALTKVVSISSVSAALAVTPLQVFLGAREDRLLFSLLCGAAALLLLARHYGNIVRLMRGTEHRFCARKGDAK
jgi:glycerol-3-phosphate acyltransferase PlsY